MKIHSAAFTAGTFAMLALLGPSRGFAKRPPKDPATTCAADELMIAGVGAKAVMACHVRAAGSGKPVDEACLFHATNRVIAFFGRAEQRGGCASTGDAAGVNARLVRQAAAAAAVLRPAAGRSKCASGELRSIGSAAFALLRVRAKYVLRPSGKTFVGGRSTATTRLKRALAASARKSNCGTVTDVATGVAYADRMAGVAGPLRARLEATKIIRIADAGRAEVLAKRTTAEGLGFTVADDGSTLTGVARPLGGWRVVLGSGDGRSDATGGVVTVNVPSDPSIFEGQAFHPGHQDFVAGPVYLPDLAAEGEALQTITFAIRNNGPCGMNAAASDDSTQCAAHAGVRGRERAALNPDPQQFPPKVTRELGTYPNDAPGTQQVACLDYDGLIESHTDRGDSSLTGIIAYPGSTCNYQVDVGCCDNEAADVRRIAAGIAFGPEEFPILHCPDNHHGRFCQSVTKGDVSLKVRGDVIKAGGSQSYEVSAGETVPITVHNNGCYAETHVTDGLFASFIPLGGHLSGGPLEGRTIKHYTGVGGGSYRADQEIQYVAPSPCPPNVAGITPTDEYAFETDGSTAGVRFKCPTTTTTIPCQTARAGTCDVPIIDYIGTSTYDLNDVGTNYAYHAHASASFTITNDPAIRMSNGDENTFVVKSGSVTYSETRVNGNCTTTINETTDSLIQFPGGIPSAMLIVRPPGVPPFVSASFIHPMAVSETESCPPNPPTTREDGVPVAYLVIPLIPPYGLSGDGTTIQGSFTQDAETYEWHMTRSER